MKKMAFIILFPFLFQTFLFGSGLYGVMLENDALLCTCNHASAHEVHQSEEDVAFKSYKTSMKTVKETKSVKPSCHSAKKGEPHLCSCKKANKKSEYLQSFLQNSFFKFQKQCFFPENVTLFTYTEDFSSKLTGFRQGPLIPPKQV